MKEKGQLLHTPKAKRNTSNNSISYTLKDFGLSLDDSSYWQKLAGIEKDKWQELLANVDEIRRHGNDLALRLEKMDVLLSHKTNEYYTSKEHIEACREVMGRIDVDPASCAFANKIVKAKTFYDLESNGLTQDWLGNVFLNPPYGPDCSKFVSKLEQELTSGHTKQAIILVSAHGTETQWFQFLFDGTLCFVKGRLPFYDENGITAPTFGNVFIYFGAKSDKFANELKDFVIDMKEKGQLKEGRPKLSNNSIVYTLKDFLLMILLVLSQGLVFGHKTPGSSFGRVHARYFSNPAD